MLMESQMKHNVTEWNVSTARYTPLRMNKADNTIGNLCAGQVTKT